MKIYALNDNSGPKYHRILLPVYLMDGVEFISDHALIPDLLKDVDVLFFNRLISKITLNDLCKLRDKYGFKMIADFDDHWQLDRNHIAYDFYNKYMATELMIEMIKISDAVFVTHDRLYKEAKQFNENVFVIPNAIPDFGQFQISKTKSDKTRLFWAGSITHQHDIEILRNPVKKISTLPVKMVMGGYNKNHVYARMASAFTNGGKADHILLENLPVNEYYKLYSQCDISLIPLVDTRFNSFKSNIKILEAANINAPCIVSNVHPYKNIPYVNYVDKQSDWYKNVKKLINNPGLMKEQGEQLFEFCNRNFNFKKINEERRQIFNDIRIDQSVRETQACV